MSKRTFRVVPVEKDKLEEMLRKNQQVYDNYMLILKKMYVLLKEILSGEKIEEDVISSNELQNSLEAFLWNLNRYVKLSEITRFLLDCQKSEDMKKSVMSLFIAAKKESEKLEYLEKADRMKINNLRISLDLEEELIKVNNATKLAYLEVRNAVDEAIKKGTITGIKKGEEEYYLKVEEITLKKLEIRANQENRLLHKILELSEEVLRSADEINDYVRDIYKNISRFRRYRYIEETFLAKDRAAAKELVRSQPELLRAPLNELYKIGQRAEQYSDLRQRLHNSIAKLIKEVKELSNDAEWERNKRKQSFAIHRKAIGILEKLAA